MNVEKCCLDCAHLVYVSDNPHRGLCGWDWRKNISSALIYVVEEYYRATFSTNSHDQGVEGKNIFSTLIYVVGEYYRANFSTNSHDQWVEMNKPYINCHTWEKEKE